MKTTIEKSKTAPALRPEFTVDQSNSDISRYAESLFAEALRIGMANEKDAERFIGGVSTLLKNAIELQSDGESTSVKVETAQKMVASFLFTIGVALRQIPSAEDAIRRLVAESAEKLYEDGLATLFRLKSRAEPLRLLLMRTKKPDQSREYYTFIDITVKKYLDSYDPRFDAAASVWVCLKELGVDGPVTGMPDLYALMRRLYDYNTK